MNQKENAEDELKCIKFIFIIKVAGHWSHLKTAIYHQIKQILYDSYFNTRHITFEWGWWKMNGEMKNLQTISNADPTNIKYKNHKHFRNELE